jgi:YbgC/YbaW family acyl-CoA thioester hydrolase
MDAPLHRHVCEVAFGDTDASGWMHFPNTFHYFERAEHEFLKKSGLLVFERALGGWPRVKVTCEYDHPLVTGDRIEIQLGVSRIGTSSVTWEFEIHRLADRIRTAHGSVTTVRVNGVGKPQPLSVQERAVLEP